jgi:hypothetical protein
MQTNIDLSANDDIFSQSSPRVTILPPKHRKALLINEVFNRYHAGQASIEDKKLVEIQQKRWKQLSFNYSRKSVNQKTYRYKRMQELPLLIAKARLNGKVYEVARLCVEYYSLT